MFFVGLKDKLVIKLDDLETTGLLTGNDDVAVLSHLDRGDHIFELEYFLHRFQRIDLILRRWRSQPVYLNPGGHGGSENVGFIPGAEGQIGPEHIGCFTL